MKILNMVSKSFTCPPVTLKFLWSEISMVVEISTDCDLLSIIEFQINGFIWYTNVRTCHFCPDKYPYYRQILAKFWQKYFQTADTHEYHLERLVKKCLIERGYPEIIDNEGASAYPEQPLAYFIVQIDKSTCQSYNYKEDVFSYRGVLTF